MRLPSQTLPDRFSLGPWQVSVSLDEVAGNGKVHKLEPRAMRLLVVLAQATGEVVLTDDLLSAVWPGLIVTPSSLYDAIAQLRRVLGPEHIATVARKGYRLVTTVTDQTASAQVASSAALPVQATRLSAPGPAEPRLGPSSVAVLPFVARGLPESLSFLSESLAGALIAEISRQPGLAVVALGTMLTFGQRHPPPRQLAEDLGVRYVVDGELELRGDTLHVSVQVADGQRGTQTWADELTLPASAWHATATVVVGRLARALRFELNDLASRETLAPASDAEVQARALTAQAWVQLYARAQTPDTNQRATRLARSAVALAPELSQAWMCLAYADWRAGHYRWSDEARDEQLARALAEAERAVALDPRDPDAHYVLSLTARHYRGQRLRSDEALRHCLRLSSSYAPAYGLLAMSLERHGRHDEARAYCDKAFELSPLEPLRVIWHYVRAEASLATGDPQGALEEAQRGVAVNPTYAQSYVAGTVANWRLGAVAQAHEWLATLRQHPAFCSLEAIRITLAGTFDPAAMGQLDRLLETLREAGLPEK
jgi:DNA-binding winged helix-turn-helix (wHTH) protein/tetratricopeptide (TPR) repeat protein